MAKHNPGVECEQGCPYFNTYHLPEKADRFITSVDEACRKLLGDNYTYWCTLDGKKEKLRAAWDCDILDIKLYWAVSVIKEYGYIIWNQQYVAKTKRIR